MNAGRFSSRCPQQNSSPCTETLEVDAPPHDIMLCGPMKSTRRGVVSAVERHWSPCPSCPLSPAPHVKTAPLMDTAAVCAHPAETMRTRMFLSESTTRGTSSSSWLPCPNRPLSPQPKLQTLPLTSRAALWETPAATWTTPVSGARCSVATPSNRTPCPRRPASPLPAPRWKSASVTNKNNQPPCRSHRSS